MKAIERNAKGTFHITPRGRASRYEFAAKILSTRVTIPTRCLCRRPIPRRRRTWCLKASCSRWWARRSPRGRRTFTPAWRRRGCLRAKREDPFRFELMDEARGVCPCAFFSARIRPLRFRYFTKCIRVRPRRTPPSRSRVGDLGKRVGSGGRAAPAAGCGRVMRRPLDTFRKKREPRGRETRAGCGRAVAGGRGPAVARAVDLRLQGRCCRRGRGPQLPGLWGARSSGGRGARGRRAVERVAAGAVERGVVRADQAVRLFRPKRAGAKTGPSAVRARGCPKPLDERGGPPREAIRRKRRGGVGWALAARMRRGGRGFKLLP